jgi:hypothetical protein
MVLLIIFLKLDFGWWVGGLVGWWVGGLVGDGKT